MRDVWAEKSEQIDSIFSSWPGGESPGAVVGVVLNDHVAHLKGYGFSNIEVRERATPRTQFRLASITKQFTAAAIMLLRESGALGYDDPASKFLPEFSPHARGVTVRHLLQHTSGIADYQGLFLQTGAIEADYPRSSKQGASPYEPSTRDALALACSRPLRFAPGDEWEYSNSGYVALARIAEEVSGRSFTDFLWEKIFAPLGMTDTRLYGVARPDVLGGTLSYTREGEGFRDIDYTPLNAVYGQDGIYSTGEDLVKWYRALGGGRLFKAETLREAFASGDLNVGARASYGFGWFVANSLGLRRASHTGSWGGFRNFAVHYPDKKFTAFVLSNFDEFDHPARSATACRLAAVYLSDEMTFRPAVSLREDALRRYEGRYELGGGKHLDVALDGDALRIGPPGLFPFKLIPESEVKFFVAGAKGDTYFFHDDCAGRMWGVTRHLSLFGYSKDAYTTALKIA